MRDATIARLNRDSVIDTSLMPELMFTIATAPTRAVGAVSDTLATVIGRLILGQPVQRADLERHGVGVMELMRATDIDFSRPAQMADAGLAGLRREDAASNVVPLKS